MIDQTASAENNSCLVRIPALAIWARNLSDSELRSAVKLQTLFTHSNQISIEATYLYAFAIKHLLKGIKP